MHSIRTLFPILAALLLLLAGSCGTRHPRGLPDDEAMQQRSDEIRLQAINEPRPALGRAFAMLAHADSLGHVSHRALAQRTIAQIYDFLDRSDSAMMFLMPALEQAHADMDSSALLDGLVIRNNLLFALGKFDSALITLDEAWRYVDPVRDTLSMAMILHGRGNILIKRGSYTQAVKAYIESARLFDQLHRDRDLATAYGNIAIANADMGETRKAIEYYEKAIGIHVRTNSKHDIARNYANIGVAYKDAGDLSKAIESYEKSLALSRELGATLFLAQNLLNMGNIYMEQGRTQDAARAYGESLELSRANDIPYGVMMNCIALGTLHAREGRAQQSIASLSQALQAAESMNLPHEVSTIYSEMSKAASLRKDYEQAYRYFVKYDSIRDTLQKHTEGREFRELQVAYEAEKKEHEIQRLTQNNRIARLTLERQRVWVIAASVSVLLLAALLVVLFLSRRQKIRSLRMLEEKNAIIQQKSGQLAESNSLKELLLDIITHDLMNPIGAIVTSAEMLRGSAEDEELLDVITRATAQVVGVTQNAAALSRAVMNEEIPKEPLPLHLLVRSVQEEFRRQFDKKGMSFENLIPEELRVEANAVIAEVIKNFASNALRHASSGKRFVVDAVEHPTDVVVRFTDFGDTIPEPQRRIIFERRVQLSDSRRGSGLGLAIVERIVHAHGGEVWVEPNEPTGNMFCVRLARHAVKAEQEL